MKFHEIVTSEHVHLDVQARDPVLALHEAAASVADEIGIETETIVKALVERERLGSTSVGSGFAIPHCKIDGLDRLVVSLVRFKDPVEFGGVSNEPVRFFFSVLSPPDQPAAHLQVLSQIARILKREDLRERLMSARDPDEIVATIKTAAEAEGL